MAMKICIPTSHIYQVSVVDSSVVSASSTMHSRMFQWADEPMNTWPAHRLGPQEHHYAPKINSAVSSAPKQGSSIKLFLEKFDDLTGSFWFGVCPAPAEVVKMIQSLNEGTYRYLVSVKLWIVNFALYERLVCLLNSSSTDYKVEEIPRFLVKGLNMFLKANSDLAHDPSINVSEAMAQKLLPFQFQGVKFVVQRGGRALIGDEMGCGKVNHIYAPF